MNRLLLSENPWICTCKFTVRLREFLIKYNSIIKDVSDITCTIPDRNDTSEVQILSIKMPDVCDVSQEETEFYFLDAINIVLGILVISIITKFCYDYHRYRKYGQVPWIVMKMP